MWLALFVVAALAGGGRLAMLLWSRGERPGPVETASSWLVLALSVAIGVDWILALTHLFTRTALVVASVAILAASYPLFVAARRVVTSEVSFSRAETLVVGGCLLPVVLWLTYILFRGSVVFVADHDGLGYHMPKALIVVQHHGYHYVDASLRAIPTFPMDHELLLADVVALTGADDVTEWASTAMYVLFGVVAGGLAERWWGRGLHVLAVALVTWAMPVALIHSGAHKNDLMFAVCALAAMSFAARWATTGDLGSLVVGLAALLIAGGTKVSGVFVVVAVLPAVVARGLDAWRGRKMPKARHVLGVASLALGMSLALGWAMYLLNYAHDGHIVDTHGGGYGAWYQLWMLPVLMFVKPFCPPAEVWVPWLGRSWFDPKWDLFFSTLGMTTSLMAVALPFAIARFRRMEPERRRERLLVSLGALILFLGIAPAEVHPPFGFFIEHTRYLMFLTPVLAAWTVAPIVREGPRALAYGLTGVLVVAFSYEAVLAAIHDAADPFAFFVAVIQHPEKLDRVAPTDMGRAAMWADRHAGPDDAIAFDGELTGWPYPLYGRELRRRVVYLHSEAGRIAIPDDVKWVVVDRAWNALFDNPGFVDLGGWRQYIGRGTPKPEDLVVLHALENDPRFQLAYWQPSEVQAVFVRR